MLVITTGAVALFLLLETWNLLIQQFKSGDRQLLLFGSGEGREFRAQFRAQWNFYQGRGQAERVNFLFMPKNPRRDHEDHRPIEGEDQGDNGQIPQGPILLAADIE